MPIESGLSGETRVEEVAQHLDRKRLGGDDVLKAAA
jgi:hypothetical protein